MLKNLYVLNLVFEVFSEVMFKALNVEKVVKRVFYKTWRYSLNRLEKKGYLINYSWVVVCCCWRGMFHPHQVFPPLPCASRSKNWSGWKLTIWKKKKVDPVDYIATQIPKSTQQERMRLEVVKKAGTPPLCIGWIG